MLRTGLLKLYDFYAHSSSLPTKHRGSYLVSELEVGFYRRTNNHKEGFLMKADKCSTINCSTHLPIDKLPTMMSRKAILRPSQF